MSQQLRAKPDYILRRVVDEWILMPVGEQAAIARSSVILDDVASFIYQQLQSSVSRQDVLQAILDEYDVDADTAGKDLDELLDRLRGFGVLE